MRSFPVSALALVLCSACTALPSIDPANPYLLNEQAMREVQAGRAGMAEILLERAVLIAPHEDQIRHNRDTLRAYLAGQATAAQAAQSVPAAAPPQEKPAIEPRVLLWPAK